MSAPLDCGIEMARGTEGYLCGQMGSELCSDCGTSLCDLHADACEVCLQIFCRSCLNFHMKEPHTRKQALGATVPEYRRSA
jgi:predicted sulfurtransferase